MTWGRYFPHPPSELWYSEVWLIDCLHAAMSSGGDVGKQRCRAKAKAGGWLANRPREISSAQARRQDACFFRKMEKSEKT